MVVSVLTAEQRGIGMKMPAGWFFNMYYNFSLFHGHAWNTECFCEWFLETTRKEVAFPGLI